MAWVNPSFRGDEIGKVLDNADNDCTRRHDDDTHGRSDEQESMMMQ